MKEDVYVTIWNPAFCLFLYLTGVNFRGEFQHGGDVSQQKIKCRPIKDREIGGVSLSNVLYGKALTGRNSTCLSITTGTLWYILVGQGVIISFNFISKFEIK